MTIKYTEEFRRDAVRIATASGLTRPQVASDLGGGLSTLNKWETRRQAEGAIFQYINGFYNPGRRHSSLDGKSPLSWIAMQSTAGQCVAFERKAA